jgi:hypothetical protein
MADKKISQLTNIAGADLVSADEFVVVDNSLNETKAITFEELKNAFDTSTGFVRITGDTMTGNLSFGDDDKVILGTDDDLQVYFDGTVGQVTSSINVTGSIDVTDASTTRTNLDVDQAGTALAFAIALG